MSRQKIPEEQVRVPIFGRVKPETKKFLETLKEPNHGRAIDRLVDTARQSQESLPEESPPG